MPNTSLRPAGRHAGLGELLGEDHLLERATARRRRTRSASPARGSRPRTASSRHSVDEVGRRSSPSSAPMPCPLGRQLLGEERLHLLAVGLGLGGVRGLHGAEANRTAESRRPSAATPARVPPRRRAAGPDRSVPRSEKPPRWARRERSSLRGGSPRPTDRRTCRTTEPAMNTGRQVDRSASGWRSPARPSSRCDRRWRRAPAAAAGSSPVRSVAEASTRRGSRAAARSTAARRARRRRGRCEPALPWAPRQSAAG